jgi:hypothetical protein
MLRLAPYVDCNSAGYKGIMALAAPTFIVFVVGFPVACSWALWRRASRVQQLVAGVEFMQAPLRAAWWAPLWAGPVRFGRKFLFAALVGGARAEDYAQVHARRARRPGPLCFTRPVQTLPILLFASLLALLLLQVCLGAARSAGGAITHASRCWCVPMRRRATICWSWAAW